MQDRPTALELLELIEKFLEEEVVPATEGRTKFQTRVSINALRIIRRELEQEEANLRREWAGLDRLIGVEDEPVSMAALKEGLLNRNARLCQQIRDGGADDGEWAAAVFTHVRQTVRDKAAIADPRLL
jgi:Domain of unknown function (DUF6285)